MDRRRTKTDHNISPCSFGSGELKMLQNMLKIEGANLQNKGMKNDIKE